MAKKQLTAAEAMLVEKQEAMGGSSGEQFEPSGVAGKLSGDSSSTISVENKKQMKGVSPHQALFDSIPQTGLKCDILFLVIKNRIQEEPEYVKRLRVVFQFNITKNGELAATWTCDTRTTIEGDIYRTLPKPGLKADCILTVDDDDWVKIMVGKLNPQRAFMMSKFKIKGNIMLLQKLHAVWYELRRKGKTPELDLIQEIMVDEPLLAGLKSEAMAIEIVQRIVKMPHLVERIAANIQINILKEGQLMTQYLIGLHPARKPEFKRLYNVYQKQQQADNNPVKADVQFTVEDDDLVLIIYGLLKVQQAVAAVLLLLLINSAVAAATLTEEANQDLQQDNNKQQLVKSQQRHSIRLEDGSTTFVSTLEEYLAREEQQMANKTEEEAAATNTAATQVTTKQFEESRPQRLLSLESVETTTIKLKEEQQHAQTDGRHSTQHHPINSSTATTSQKPTPQYWQVKSLLNVTHDYPLAYSQIICGYVWPLIAAITMFTNLMIVFVLTQRDMRTPTNVVLMAIAIADIIPIVVPVPWFVYLFAMGNEKKVLYPPILCYFYQHSTRSVSEVFYFLSTWLNVLLAVHDYLTACWPQLAKKYCQIKFVVIEIVWLTLLAFALNLPQALKLVYKPVKFIYNGQITWGCRALQAKWFKELVGEYVALYDDIFAAVIVLFVDGGPAIALIALTALLIRQLHRQRIRGHLLMEQARTASKRRRERHRQQEYESSARVMIFVLLAFLAVKIPFATTYTLMIIQSRFEIHFVENLNDFQKAITLIDLVFVLSYPLNFTIFCCCSKKFRHKCVQLLAECDRNTKTAKKRLLVKLNDSFNTSFNSQDNDDDDNDDDGGDLSSVEQMSANHQKRRRNRNASLASSSLASNADLLHLNNNNQQDSVATCSNHHHKSIMEELRKLTQQERRERILAERQVSFSSSTSGLFSRRVSQNQHQHHQQQQQSVAATSIEPNFRAVLEEGNICMECILHYERLKHSLSGKRSESEQTQQTPASRRTSECSDSWPPAPPLPQLPSIHITQFPSSSTSCIVIGSGDVEDMIAERPGSEDAATLPEESGCVSEHQPAKQPTSDETTTSEQVQVSNNKQVSQIEYAELDTRNRLRVRRSEQEDRSVEAGGRGRLPRPITRRSSSARGRSDPGTGTGTGLLRKLSDLVIRRSDNNNDSTSSNTLNETANKQLDSNSSLETDDIIMSRIAERHRSLSMSNSKLSALPDATGFLADILKATLLAPPPSASSEQSSDSLNLSSGGNLSRKRRENYAHRG